MDTQHVKQENLYATVLDGLSLSAEELSHLANCARCQGDLQRIEALAHELRVARSAQPSLQAREAYLAIFQEFGPPRRGALERARHWIKAALVLDSRLQPTPSGTRSVRADSYRLLYDSSQADVELFVEGAGLTRCLRGEVMLFEADDWVELASGGGALVQLQDEGGYDVLFETVTDEEGGFSFESVPTGAYTLLITASTTGLLEISGLTIT